MKTSLQAIARQAADNPSLRFENLYTRLNERNLHWSFKQLRQNAATGVDQLSYQDYKNELDGNLSDLVERLKQKRYRAQLIRRTYIPKPGSDQKRPLGIPALEDKILQGAVAQMLSAIHEADFLDCSYGYRPARSAHQALEDLDRELHQGNYRWVVEADIRGFFEHLDHDWLVRMLERRVNGRALIRLIKKWLKAGVLEAEGEVIHPVTGCPQGGIISPVLSNIYLHYVLDLWFEKRVAPSGRGKGKLFRYADDFVAAFESQQDAQAFERQLKERLAQFGLEVATEKTRTLRFSRGGSGSNGRFDFLGFEFSWGKSRKGRAMVKRRTSPKKLRSSLRNFTDWIRTNRKRPFGELMGELRQKLRGYGNYYGLQGNADSLNRFFYWVRRGLFKWLNRRSQKRSLNWLQFDQQLQRHRIEPPRVRRALACQLELGFNLIALSS